MEVDGKPDEINEVQKELIDTVKKYQEIIGKLAQLKDSNFMLKQKLWL